MSMNYSDAIKKGDVDKEKKRARVRKALVSFVSSLIPAILVAFFAGISCALLVEFFQLGWEFIR